MRLIYEPTINRELEKKDPMHMQKKVVLEIPCDNMNLVEFMESMVKPMLLSMGYTKVAIDKFITINEED